MLAGWTSRTAAGPGTTVTTARAVRSPRDATTLYSPAAVPAVYRPAASASPPVVDHAGFADTSRPRASRKVTANCCVVVGVSVTAAGAIATLTGGPGRRKRTPAAPTTTSATATAAAIASGARGRAATAGVIRAGA